MKHDPRENQEQMPVGAPAPLRRGMVRIARAAAELGAVGVVVLVALSLFFFATREISIPIPKLEWLVNRFTPNSISIEYDTLDLKLRRPDGLFFAKQVSVTAEKLCVRYADEAGHVCLGTTRLAATVGWGGARLEGERAWLPRLIEIEPVELLKGDVALDLARFPKSEKKTETSSFDVVDFVRTQILPKWRIEGSRVELKSFGLASAGGDRIFARAQLVTTGAGVESAVHIELEKLTESAHQLQSALKIDVSRPTLVSSAPKPPRGSAPASETVAGIAERLGAEIHAAGFAAWVSGGRRSRVDLDTTVDAKTWRSAGLKLRAKFSGLSGLREATLSGRLDQPAFDGKISVKLGESGSRIRALDFVDCGIVANLDKKTGGLNCGPSTVRVVLYERGPIKGEKLFVLAPRFDLQVSKIRFGKEKSADFDLALDVDHLGFLNERSQLSGHVSVPSEGTVSYQVEGAVDLKVTSWERVVALVAETPYSVPAPLNDLTGGLSLGLTLGLNEKGGQIAFKAATALDSSAQAVHLRLEGATSLAQKENGLEPATVATLFIDRLAVSAPRFDLRVPPRLKLDSRFGPLTAPAPPAQAVAAPRAKSAEAPPAKAATGKPTKTAPPMNLRLKIVTTQAHAILIATNLTKGDIPIDLDLVYQEKATETVALGKVVAGTPGKTTKAPPVVLAKPPSLTGTVVIGQTPIEIFRRNATLEQLKIDLLPNGTARVDGSAKVVYLDYAIAILLTGSTAEPQLKFASDPPLADDQILAVLLFGHPLNELGSDQQSSVGNLKSAFADAALGLSSLYLLANTPIESVGYDPDRQLVTAKVGIGGGASIELGAGSDSNAIGIKKKLTRDFSLRSDVETLGSSGKKTVSALIEWVKRF